MANKTIDQLDIVSSVSAVDSYIELEVGGVSKKAYFAKSGTWTPVLYGTTSAGTGTYTTQAGYYTLIGNLCFINCYLNWSAHTGAGNMEISGLPFTVKTGVLYTIPLSVYHSGLTLSANSYAMAITRNATDVIVPKQNTIAGGTAADITLDTSALLIISGFYFI